MLVVVLLFLVHHVLGEGNIDSDDTSKPPLRFLKKVNSCNSAGFFTSPETIQKKFGFGLCYLCFCFDEKQAICFLRKNMQCEKKNYINFSSSEQELYKQITALKNGKCNPFQDIHSIGCPPDDWCEGCKICDCVSDNKWNCQHVKYCDINGKKDRLRLTIANLKEEIKAQKNMKDVSNEKLIDSDEKFVNDRSSIKNKDIEGIGQYLHKNSKHTKFTPIIYKKELRNLLNVKSRNKAFPQNHTILLAQNIVRRVIQKLKRIEKDGTYNEMLPKLINVIRNCTHSPKSDKINDTKSKNSKSTSATISKEQSSTHMVVRGATKQMRQRETFRRKKRQVENNTAVLTLKKSDLLEATNNKTPKDIKIINMLNGTKIPWYKTILTESINKSLTQNSTIGIKNTFLVNASVLNSNKPKEIPKFLGKLSIINQSPNNMTDNAYNKTKIQTAIRQNINLTGYQDTNNTVDSKKRKKLIISNQNAQFTTEFYNGSIENLKENNKTINVKDISKLKVLNINSEEQKQKGIIEINELNVKKIENDESTVEEKTRNQINEKHTETASENILGDHTFLNTQDDLSSKENVDNVLVKNLFSSNTTHQGAEKISQFSQFVNPIIRITNSSEKLNENKSDLNMNKVRKGPIQIKEDYGLKNNSQIPRKQSNYSSTSDTLLRSKDVNTTKYAERSATSLDLDLLDKYSVYVIENTTSQNAADVRNSTMVDYYKYTLAESNERYKSSKNLSKTRNGNVTNDSLIIAINKVEKSMVVTTTKSTVVRNVDRLKMYRTKIIGTPKKFTVKRILKMAIPHSRNADRISFDRSTTPYETKRRENLKDVIDKLLNIFNSKENRKSVAHNVKKKNNVMSYFSKIIRKMFYKINKDHKKNLKTGYKVNNKVNVLNKICEILENCNFNPDSYVVVHNKIHDLNKDFRRIMESIKIIKDLLDLTDFGVDLRNNTLTRAGVKHGHNLNADLIKLRLILQYNSTRENDKHIHLTETELKQINYTKSNVKTLTQSVKSFVNNLKDIISILQNQNTKLSRKIRTISNENMEIPHYLKNIQRLLDTYGHMQSSLMENVKEIVKKINKDMENINNKNNLKKIKNSKRRKRYAMDGDETLEYMLVLIEYLLKKKVVAAEANDGIDAIIKAIRNAPEIKPFQKFMDREKTVKIANFIYDNGAVTANKSNERYISSTTSYYGKKYRKSFKNIFDDIYDEDNTVISKPIQEYKSFFIDEPISQLHASNKKSSISEVEIESSKEDHIGIAVPIENKKGSFLKDNITLSQASNKKSDLSQVEIETSQINNDKENKSFNSKLFSSIIDQEISVGLEESLENSQTFSNDKEQNKKEDVYNANLDENDTFIKYFLPYKKLSNYSKELKDSQTVSNESNENTTLNEVAPEKTKFNWLEEPYEQKNKNLNYRTTTTRTKTIKPTKNKLIEKYEYKDINDYDYKPKITSKEVLAVKTNNFLNSLDYGVTDKMDVEDNDY